LPPILRHNEAVKSDIDRILIASDQIRERVREMAGDIAAHYQGRPGGLTLVPILSGSIIFLADLIREMPMKMKLAMVQLSSYRERTAPGELRQVMELNGDIRGRHVLIVDDILDTGGTLAHVQGTIRRHGAASLQTAVLLRKPGKAPPAVEVDFVGFDIDDLFVVGYGLDCGDLYRNYPHIGVLKSELMP
jgi:hypoxanthine phosphoribosyltransferase